MFLLITYHQATRGEFEIAIEWAAGEGWNPGLHDAEIFLTGMGVVRPCGTGFKLGPLFADDALTAHKLFQALSSHACGQPIYLDIPENNPAAIVLAEQHQLEEVFGCARMYQGPAPELP